MALATTEKFQEMTLSLGDGGGTEVFTNICGLIGVTVSRTATVDEVEVPDCTDESLPLSVSKAVRAISVTVTATGVWAKESWGDLSDWFYSSAAKNVRIGNLVADVGDTEYETGPAFLTQLDNAREKGKVVTADVTIVFNGTPTRTDAT